ncbi:amidohydrolase family protein [Cellvibrio sp. KY-YJ-3]|uniref:N-acyl-D-amino-acid deacylase family protein n=1 Tax=Cellvibrio sp. KY-YJ-3 TaxID=454662 RepID=UPI001248BFE0|nr:D-aminoacylase [Cellvibrio sp. KY-YJ-3]QEY11166.1 D-aminoacylase [Cellvibrio sp. KY-YJ-3]
MQAVKFDCVIYNALILDGSGASAVRGDLAIHNGKIAALGDLANAESHQRFDAQGWVLAPGFIDVHTHDDIQVIRTPNMLPKISQGITTVIVGNCGISASPVTLKNNLPDPMNLLGSKEDFCFPDLATYKQAVNKTVPAVNVAALIGHTALRNNHMDRLDRSATDYEIAAMRLQLRTALAEGALGLSSGLAYASAFSSSTEEVKQLAQELNAAGAIYTTHLRTEFDEIIAALEEAFDIGEHAQAPVIVSHLKCAGAGNWGRSGEVLQKITQAATTHPIGCDCYPYSASSSTLDLQQVTSDFDIVITWSKPHPEQGGKKLADIAQQWQLDLLDAAKKLQPAGAVYYGMSEQDVQKILAHPLTMIGSDGLPVDPLPHPRLWGAFPRVLGHYSRDLQLFELAEAVRKMTRMSADRFGLDDRGRIEIGAAADLVVFNPNTVKDAATFEQPQQLAEGIEAVWVNGVLTYSNKKITGKRAGKFLEKQRDLRIGFY